MRKKLKRIFALTLSVLMFAGIFSVTAMAAGKIITDKNVRFTINYKDEGTAIPNAHFSLYKVADTDEYERMSVNAAFEKYKNSVSGLNDLNNLTQDEWFSMASTLKGYVLRDGVPCTASGNTDADGSLVFPELEVGLYLAIGSSATTSDFHTYYASPFMVFLPAEDDIENDWNYDAVAVPKYTMDVPPPDTEDEFITRKVLKIWDDTGYESIRPENVTVQLLKNGEIYDTQVLSQDNNWRYAWDNLDRNCEWDIVEKEVKGYAVSVSQSGITYTITNKFVEPIVGTNIPIQKRITGDKPDSDAKFKFVFSADDKNNPMPAGSDGSEKEITIVGAGSEKIGEIKFTEPGIYNYSISEKNLGIEGYTYDKTVFSVKYDVVQNDGVLTADITITDNNGKEVSAVEFTNVYKKPHDKLPQTGMLWWPVPILLCIGLILLSTGLICRRR